MTLEEQARLGRLRETIAMQNVELNRLRAEIQRLRELLTKIAENAAWMQKKVCAYTGGRCDCKFVKPYEDDPDLWGAPLKFDSTGEHNGCPEMREIVNWCQDALGDTGKTAG